MKKITAGNGYTYLTKQVAAGDVDRGRVGLADYYNEKGESPGRWWGAGLAGLELEGPVSNSATPGARVSEAQMRALFGEGLHPDADLIERAEIKLGATVRAALRASKLGSAYLNVEARSERGDERTGFQTALEAAYARWREDHGGLARVPEDVRRELTTSTARRMFAAEHGREPSAADLSGFIARQTRPRRQPVAGYDVVFSPVKSVSLLWALADLGTSRLIARLHEEAVDEALGWAERTLLFTREGANGARQVETRGMIVARFQHRDSRAGDPDLHTHCAISNKVQTLSGKWLSIDGRVIHQGMVALSERYNTIIEAKLEAELGVEFRETGREGRRPVREVAGVPDDLIAGMSSRRRSIEDVQARLTARFQADHGRLPTPVEAHKLAQQATLATRPDKPEARSFAQQRAEWAPRAEQILGRPVSAMLADVTRPGRRRRRRRDPAAGDGSWDLAVEALADEVLRVVSNGQAVFRDTHVMAEAQRAARRAGWPAAGRVDAADRIAAAALSRCVSLARPEPAEIPAGLRRSDGASVYRSAHSGLFTTQETMDAERRIVAAAGLGGGRRAGASDVGLALIRSDAGGTRLNQSQRRLVAELATSGRRVQLAMAPAGSGKTTAMAVLADVWRGSGGDIIGLAHQATAADQLRQAIGDESVCDTLARLTYWLRGVEVDGVPVYEPSWASRVGRDTLIVVDEAGMAATADLDALVSFASARGASVRLVGDDRQLAAVGSGGVLRDVETAHGSVTLDELVRFRDPALGPAEGLASLGLRNGDHDALGFYTGQGRVTPVTDDTAVAALLADWTADTAAGARSMMLATTLEEVHRLNEAARQQMVRAGQVSDRRVVRLAGGLAAGAGDTVVTRRNARRLRIGRTDFVKNRDRWNVLKTGTDGSLQVQHERSRRLITLPADYVREHVDLGYASTITGAQGVTVDRCRVLVRGSETRNALYVAATRGAWANQLYVVTGGDSDPEQVVFDERARLRTAVENLEAILDRAGGDESASTVRRELSNPFRQLGADVDVYRDAVQQAALAALGDDGVAAIAQGCDRAARERGLPALTSLEGWTGLLNRLALLAGQNIDPGRAIAAALDQRELPGDEAGLVAVLGWRLAAMDDSRGPLAWLPAAPEALAGRLDPAWRRFLAAHAGLIEEESRAVQQACRAWTEQTAPRWAAPFVADHPGLVAETALWRAAHNIPDNEARPVGPRPDGLQVEERQAWNSLHQRLCQAAETGMWGVPAAVAEDSYWPVVAARLSRHARLGDRQRQTIAAVLLSETAHGRPLDVERPAADLWHRVAASLQPGPAQMPDRPAGRLLPWWWDQGYLRGALPDDWIAGLPDDPGWASLVAALRDVPDPQVEPALQTACAIAAAQHHPREAIAQMLAGHVLDLVAPPPVEEPPPDPRDDREPPDADQAVLPGRPPAERSGEPEPEWDWADNEPDQDWAGHEPDWDWADREPEPEWTESERTEPERGGDRREPAPSGPRTNREDREPEPGGTGLQRILALNADAARFYASHYKGSGAARHTASRFGSDLADDPRFNLGYAPPGWDHLTRHLTSQGATPDELVDAGLSQWSKRGSLIDVFRDRLTIAVTDHIGNVRGFTGRAAPGADPRTPKYLNTPTTAAFLKGAHLYGEDLIDDHTTPVLVEGALDAIAVTLAGRGRAVGLAPCGTALTTAQADKLAGRLVLVGTDNDSAGWKAAERDHGLLTAVGADPRRLPLQGKDPGEMFTTNPDTLTLYLDNPDLMAGLGAAIVCRQAQTMADNLDPARPEADLHQIHALVRQAADLIAATPESNTARDQADRDLAAQAIADLPSPYHADVAAVRDWIDDSITEHDIDTITTPEPDPPDPPPTADFDTLAWLDRLAASHTGPPRHDPANQPDQPDHRPRLFD
jgi:conjugative relaxase-like TrwC/TraI family protein